MKKRSRSPSILANGFRKGNDVFMQTGEEKQDESDDDCVVLEVIPQNKHIKRQRADSTSTVSEGSFKSVSSKSNYGNEHRVIKTSPEKKSSEPPANSRSLVSPLPNQVRLDCIIETGEGETAAPAPSSTMSQSQPKTKCPDWLSETYVKANSLNDLNSSGDRSVSTATCSSSQNSQFSFTRRNSEEVHVLLSEENENYGESVEDDVFSDGNVEVVDYSENERTRHQSDGDVGVVPTLEPSQSEQGDAQPTSLSAEQAEIMFQNASVLSNEENSGAKDGSDHWDEPNRSRLRPVGFSLESNNSGVPSQELPPPGAVATSEAAKPNDSTIQSGTVTVDDNGDIDPLSSIDRIKFRNRSRSPQVTRNLSTSNRSVERSDDAGVTTTRNVTNRRSSRDDEFSDHEYRGRGTKRAYEEKSSSQKRKRYADSHQRRSRHYEREQRSRKRSRSSPRRHERYSRGRGFSSEYYGPRGNFGWNNSFRPVHGLWFNKRTKKFENRRDFYDTPNFNGKKRFWKDTNFPSKIHKNYGSSEMAGSSQSARLLDKRNPSTREGYLRTERERVNKDMNIATQSTQTGGSLVVSSSPRIEKEKDNLSVDAARPTTTQNCNGRSASSPPSAPVASNGDNRDVTRERPTARDILDKLKKCPFPTCRFRSDCRHDTRSHLKVCHKMELCMFCLPDIHCVDHRNSGTGSLSHFNKDHAISEKDPKARCILCDKLCKYEGIYVHMSTMHFRGIENSNEKPLRRTTKKEKEEKVKPCMNVQSEAASCSTSPNSSSPIVDNNMSTTATSDMRTRKFGENFNTTASRLEGRANQNPTTNRRSADLIHPQRVNQVPRPDRQHAVNPNPRIRTQQEGTETQALSRRSNDVEENIRNASRSDLAHYTIPKKKTPN